MSVAKRLCLLVFGLSGTFCLIALTLPWFGPWTRGATALLSERWYYIAVEATLAVTAAGVLSCLLRAALSPRQRRVVIVERVGSDQITVTRAAISAQATHIVERGGTYAAERVWVSARKRSVSVAVRVRPARPVDVTEEGPRLHDDLVAGLSTLVGDAIAGVELEFVEASAQGVGDYGVASDGASLGGTALATLADEPPSPAALPGGDVSEITVPLGRATAQGGDTEEGE